eukprot:TRINITY_DN19939_c0_g1_i1.p1 TRINITY_DN19939_c0_g1~~TRINITY_DN19939_c0_g1_i1.p1  ORF type:complete len:1300 (-),score=327.52 TRINITY_DN19939_c0_g1_i1:220-4062(-)
MAPKKRQKLELERSGNLGRIEKLIIENFKSYCGRHEIGPFDKFTCIIGPNGAGKSNVMDAISFCLGIKARHLRGDRLKDLVYRCEEEDVDSNTRTAEVTLVFQSGSGQVIHFGRRINERGEGIYRFGTPEKQKNMEFGEFQSLLANEQIFVKARNFLVFQGDVMQLSRRQGTELTGVLETISGSEQLKDDYVKLSRDLELMQEKARLHFQHRREAENIMALLEAQRDEVEKYQRLRKERDALALETALFRLFCAERHLTSNRQVAAEIRKEDLKLETDSRSRRREVEVLEGDRRTATETLEKAQSHHFILTTNVEQLKPEIAKCRKQASHFQAKVKEKQAAIVEEEKRLQQQQGVLEEATRNREIAEDELETLRNKPVETGIEMSADQRRRYEQAVLTADLANSKAREGLREAEEQLAQLRQKMIENQQELKHLQERKERSSAKVEELNLEKATLELNLEFASGEIQQSKQQAETCKTELQGFVAMREELAKEQNQLRFDLDVAKTLREKLVQTEYRRKVADELRGQFPGAVFGRISEIMLPTEKRYAMPLQMSLGGSSEAFVVSDAAAARQCVQYLKERRIATESFLPLDRMDDQDSRLHTMTHGSQTRRLASMCVQHNEQFLKNQELWREKGPAAIDRTVAFLLGNVIIADNLDVAKQTAFADARRHRLAPRVVTLDGEVISPNGNMSVKSFGNSAQIAFGSAEKLAEIRAKEQKLNQVTSDFTTLEDAFSKNQQRATELQQKAEDLQIRNREMEKRLALSGPMQNVEEQLQKKLEGDIKAAETAMKTLPGKIEKLAKEKRQLEADLLKAGRINFAELNEELGVEDVREVVRREDEEKRKRQVDVENFEDIVRQMKAEEQRAQQKLQTSSKMEALKRDVDQYQRDADAALGREKELAEKEKVVVEKAQVGQQRYEDAKKKMDQIDKDITTKRQELQQFKVKHEELKRKNKTHREKLRILLSIKCTILRESSEKQIEVPLQDGVAHAALEQVLSREQDIDDMPIQSLDEACKQVKVDFTALPEDKKVVAEDTNILDAKNFEMDYAAQIADIDRELDSLNPNMHAPEECHLEAEKLKQVKKLADEASLESQRLMREFETIKAKRIKLFMECFKHVEAQVNPFYKALTSYDGYEGGSAYLDLDDAEEPYNGGITFTACPPGKRFFPMELLSGGERSMASMALLFAMHSFKPPPFMILDEVDAPFDRKNTESLVNYLQKLHFQCLVISLKDTFFSHSDSIVGIYKDKDLQTSGSIRLDLKQLGGDDENPETEVPHAEGVRID